MTTKQGQAGRKMFIRMIGVFEVRDEAGQDRTPRGAKARALLALLARTPGHRRPRRWLEARLWSDRGQEQASGSLRQALTEVRKALGPLAERLTSDRDGVALAGFGSDLADPVGARQALARGREFLEGIDVLDPGSTPKKRTALGRFKHENCAMTLSADNKVVVYMGDDQANDYVY